MEGLVEFSILLVACRNVLNSGLNGGKELELRDPIRKIVLKLSYHLQEKWRYHVDRIEIMISRIALFDDLTR